MTFGRMNPPTSGHELLLNLLLDKAKKLNAKPFVFVSQTQDPKKNPLSFKEKIKFISQGMPQIKKYLVLDATIKNPFEALRHLVSLGYTDISVVVGSDRVSAFESMIRPYLNIADKTKSIDADVVKVISAVKRDPDSDDVSGMSASKMRILASSGDFLQFSSGVMSGLSEQQIKLLYKTVRQKMNLHSEMFVIQSFSEFCEEELDDRFAHKSPNLEIGTDDLVKAYREMVPGQERIE